MLFIWINQYSPCQTSSLRVCPPQVIPAWHAPRCPEISPWCGIWSEQKLHRMPRCPRWWRWSGRHGGELHRYLGMEYLGACQNRLIFFIYLPVYIYTYKHACIHTYIIYIYVCMYVCLVYHSSFLFIIYPHLFTVNIFACVCGFLKE